MQQDSQTQGAFEYPETLNTCADNNTLHGGSARCANSLDRPPEP